MFKPIPWSLIEREEEARKIIQTLRDIYGDLSNLRKFYEISKLAKEDGLISEDEKLLIYEFSMFRHE